MVVLKLPYFNWVMTVKVMGFTHIEIQRSWQQLGYCCVNTVCNRAFYKSI